EGLDSGFKHLNHLCNGLTAELFILAAPPAAGKTTLCWQICCEVTARNQVPVLVVSLEQSKEELRAKTLARLSGLNYRHIRRGRLRADDPAEWGRLLAAVKEYAKEVAPYLTVVEGDASTTVAVIRAAAAAKMRQAGADRCLVMVDY